MRDSKKIKDSIIESASWLFDKFGYEKTSVDEIAKRAHKAKASIYYYFNGKAEIFKAVLVKEFAALKEGLEEIRTRFSENMNEQLTTYMTRRMELLHSAKVYRQYMISPYIYGNNEVSVIVKESRESFDQWELDYFRHVCNEGRRLGILSEKVQPEAFAKLLGILLKGIEMQFFHLEDYESMKSTYEAMVEILIFNNKKQN